MFQICCGTNIKYIGDFWWGAYGHKHMAVGLHMGRKPYLNWSFVSRHWVLLSTSYYKMYIKLQASFKTGICRGHQNMDGAELPWLICDLQGCTATFSEGGQCLWHRGWVQPCQCFGVSIGGNHANHAGFELLAKSLHLEFLTVWKYEEAAGVLSLQEKGVLCRLTQLLIETTRKEIRK